MDDGYPFLDVEDPAAMKERLDGSSLGTSCAPPRRPRAIRSELGDVAFLCAAAHEAFDARRAREALGLDVARAEDLDDTGHMSGVDTLLVLDRAARAGTIRDGDVVLLLAAGTGYTWAASVVRWGPLA